MPVIDGEMVQEMIEEGGNDKGRGSGQGLVMGGLGFSSVPSPTWAKGGHEE